MKKTVLFTLLYIITSSVLFGQEVCESPESTDIDLNSITKCAITPLKDSKNKKSRQISVKVSARRRMLKKKMVISTNNLTTSGVSSSSNEKQTTDLVAANISKEININKNIEDLKNKLSKEEVKKALKFTAVDRIPVFDACQKVKKGEESDCFNNEMMKHISKHFSYPSEALIQNIEGEVWVRFIISKSGYVKNIKTLGPDDSEVLNNEAKRVVSLLPRFQSAKKQGKHTSVKYGFPINFSLEE
ncbi:energy transducer TonB [Tenacibaculum pacificus]|uniref:energy transducer TonB n=1 Tax=Tenacibaculum pacificus TaxID=3018314 RepID=UPI0022F3FF14|nr:energy transducer TonB [Tenacibaculum pacificus]WBX73465.1 energy transducer TonB [Tenacibaculum pacificus]